MPRRGRGCSRVAPREAACRAEHRFASVASWRRAGRIAHADDLFEIGDIHLLTLPEASSRPVGGDGAVARPSWAGLAAAWPRYPQRRQRGAGPAASRASPGLPHASDDAGPAAQWLARDRPHSPTQRSWEKGSIRGVRPSPLRTRPLLTLPRP